mmetsp:Transcript_1761/g.5285  ORF Transcript_1761/g.5285 Transcript_1761/m.5285 type:complete len:201 (+) Transcript_1761:247-849(+)
MSLYCLMVSPNSLRTSPPKAPRVLMAVTRTSGSGSSSSETTSSANAAPRSPICASALTAARRTRTSSSNIIRQISAAYICPNSPQAVTALMAWARTKPTVSPKHFTKSSRNVAASSPICPSPPSAAPLTTRWEFLISSPILPAAVELGLPVVSAIVPRALHAAPTTMGWASSRRKMSWSSNLAPESPSLPRAVADATFTS